MFHAMRDGYPMIALIMTALVAVIHLYIVHLEMVRWEAPRTRQIFGTTAEFATASKTLAANQGLYNGFLAIGLLVGLMLGTAGVVLVSYLLICVVVAGIYGAASVSYRILLVQSLPAALALAALWLGI